MRNIGVILLVLIGILVIACGSSGSSKPTESGLRERAEAFATAAGNEKWIETHRFYNPEFQESCSAGEFAINLGMGMVVLKGLMGIDEDEKIGFRVTAVTVDGLNGSVTLELLYKGEPLDFGDSDDEVPDQWAFIDEQWRYVGDADEDCAIF